MKRIKNLSLAAIAALAMTASLCAAGASASEFAAGKYSASVSSGAATHTVALNSANLTCSIPGLQGSLGAQSKTLKAAPGAGSVNCTAFPYEMSVNMNGCEFIYDPGLETSPGQYDGSFAISCPLGKAIQIGTAGKEPCVATIGSQSGLKASYQNLGSGSTATVKVNAEATGLKYTQVSGKYCSPGSFENGQWKGSWTLQASNEGIQTALRLTKKGAISIAGAPPKLTAASYPVSLAGAQGTQQELGLQYGKVRCSSATLESGPLSSTSELPVAAQYSGCTFAGFPATVKMNNCSYLFSVENAGPPYTGKESISCIGSSQIEIVATSAGKVKCTATIGTQATNAGGLSFTNEATTIGLGFAVTGIDYHQQIGEGIGACATGDHTTGTYTGSSVLTGYL